MIDWIDLAKLRLRPTSQGKKMFTKGLEEARRNWLAEGSVD